MHKHFFALVFLLLCAPATFAQRADPRDPKNEQQGIDLIKAAIAARGGEAYLKFKTIFANGTYTPYDKGVSTVPKSFQNWIAYPDRDRTEFGKGKRKNRIIQVSSGNGGWIYDGDAETLKDQSPKQIADFQEGLDLGDTYPMLWGASRLPFRKRSLVDLEQVRELSTREAAT